MSFWFDGSAADRACKFFERGLRHSKGEFAGQPFMLADWQRPIIRDVFGWRRADGTRRYRRVYIEVPRKNGKSTLCAGIALYLLFADGEAGAEVYSAAADRAQAAIVFEEAKNMARSSRALMEETDQGKTIFRRSIYHPRGGSKYEVLSADAPTKHGLNAHGIIFDELHAQPARDLWDVLTTSTGARRQPLTIAITTAGFDRESICYEIHDYARRVQSGVIEDDEFYGAIFAADDEADWTAEETWRAANPNYGVSIKPEYLAAECKRAQESPAYQNTFRRLHLDQWTESDKAWIEIETWKRCGESFDAEALAGMECYGGLDMATVTDVAAFVLAFRPAGDGPFFCLPFFWVPAENAAARERKDSVPYLTWARQGHLTLTPGNIIDWRRVQADIQALGLKYNIREIGFDRWGAVGISTGLDEAGYTVAQFGQGFASMSPPTKDLIALVKDGRLRHGNNPVLNWMSANMMLKEDPAGNLKPDKGKSKEKIDGMVALIMALGRAIVHENTFIYTGL